MVKDILLDPRRKELATIVSENEVIDVLLKKFHQDIRGKIAPGRVPIKYANPVENVDYIAYLTPLLRGQEYDYDLVWEPAVKDWKLDIKTAEKTYQKLKNRVKLLEEVLYGGKKETS